MCTLSVSNVIYHKFSHGAAFYTLNGKNVNVMLEYNFLHFYLVILLTYTFARATLFPTDIERNTSIRLIRYKCDANVVC